MSGNSSSSSAVMPAPANVFCLFSKHLCSRERLSGYDYCQRHILEDRSAPFRQCQFHVKAQRRCLRPAPKSDKKDSYCREHSTKALMARQRSGRKRTARTTPADSARRCVEELAHHKKPKMETAPSGVVTAGPASMSAPQSAPASGSTTPSSASVSSSKSAPPTAASVASGVSAIVKKEEVALAGRNVFDLLTTSLPSTSQRALEAPSDPESDHGDPPTVESSWRGDGDSDADSVDSDMEDPLKHAGSYSAEEVIRMMRDKLIRLQKLYIDQFQRLQYLLKEQRRRYRQRVQKEKEDQLMSVHSQPKDTPAEVAAYEQLRSLGHYNRPQGVEAVLHAQLMEKRVRASEGGAGGAGVASGGASEVAGKLPGCTHNLTTSTKCGGVCIPMSKYCIKHIMEDDKQILFRNCQFTTEADGPCENAIPDVFEGATCLYHTQISTSVFEEKEQERREATKEDQKKHQQPV